MPTASQPRGTVMYDAVYLAAKDKLTSEVGRKVIVLITDGVDQGSRLDIKQAIEAAQKSDAVIYSIYYYDSGAYGGHGMIMFGGGGEGYLRRCRRDRRACVQGGPEAYAARRLQGTAGRDAQPIRHRLFADER